MSRIGRALDLVTGLGALTVLERVLGTGGVVAYHAVTRDPLFPMIHITAHRLGEQLEFLAARYRVLSLHEFVSRRLAGRSLRGYVAITFDDAYEGVLDLAVPMLEKLGLPATVFVTSGYSTNGRRFWWDRLGWIRQHAPGDLRARALLAAVGNAAGREENDLAAIAATTAGRLSPEAELAFEAAERAIGPVPLRPLDEAGLTRLARSPLIDFGCHTVGHPALPFLAPVEQVTELTECTAWLRARFDNVRPFVAYPYGLYDAATIRAARAAGLTAGFSMTGRAATSRFSPLCCPRVGVADVNSVQSMRARLAWGTIPLVAFRHREWHPRLPTTTRGDPR